MENKSAKPFLKWVGGKRRLASQIADMIRPYLVGDARYVEPFLGSGAVFFELGWSGVSFLSDKCKELANCWRIVKYDPGILCNYLRTFESLQHEHYYYMIRDCPNIEKWTEISAAARTIYLNHVGFNGLYRVNSQGKFNVPYGRSSSGGDRKIFDVINIIYCSSALYKADIDCLDYEVELAEAGKGDVVYLDPPYYSSKGKGFSGYTSGEFTIDDHKNLAMICDELTLNGVYWVMTNSNLPWIRKTYKRYQIKKVQNQRSINRTEGSELIIDNFKLASMAHSR